MEVGFDIAELGAGTRRIDAGDSAFAPGMSVIGRQAETIVQRNVHAEIPDMGETAMASGCATGVAKCVRLERATAAIPKIAGASQAQGVKLAAKHKRMRQPEH